MGRDPAAVAAAFDVAAEHELVLMEAFMYRHHPQTRRLTELVAQGAIGALRLVRATFSFPLRDPADVRLSRALDGGALMDVGCYCVSAARLLAGEPAEVSAHCRLGGDGVDMRLVGSLRFEDGTLGLVDCGLDCAARDELEVVGEEATLFLGDPWHCRTPVIEHRSPAGVERIEVPAADSYRLQAENFAAAVRGEAEPLLNRADAVGQAATIAALSAAADGGGSEAPARG
jgi:xylose dehydrogenase (NAD/NADP)